LKLFKYSILAYFIVLFHSCATIVPLGGGAEDEIAPILSEIQKKNDKLILIFNENITLANETDIVSNIYPTPKFEVKRNKLLIEGIPNTEEKQLIYFNNGIQDLNANNPIQEYIYANNIKGDTFNYSGKVEFTLNPIEKTKGCYVLLTSEKVSIEKIEDLYKYEFTKTNEKGEYKFGFTKNPIGQHIFAFIDKNNNFIPDTGDYIGISKPITEDSNSTTYLDYYGKNLIYKDTLKNGIKKSVYHNIHFAVLNRGNLLYHQVNKDSLFDYSNFTDSTILDVNGPILEGEPIPILAKGAYFPKIFATDSFLQFEFNLEKDSSYSFFNDTVGIISLLKIIPKSNGSSIGITHMENYQRGFFLKKNRYYFLNSKSKPINTSSGTFTLFIYNDANNNGKYDPASLESFRPGEDIIYNMKDIDISSKTDVDISAQP